MELGVGYHGFHVLLGVNTVTITKTNKDRLSLPASLHRSSGKERQIQFWIQIHVQNTDWLYLPASLHRSSDREGQSRSGKPWQLSHSKRIQPEDDDDGDDDEDNDGDYDDDDDERVGHIP